MTKQRKPVLTAEQKKSYEDNGYFIIRKNVSSELIDHLTHRFIDICNNKITDHKAFVIVKEQSLKGTGAEGQYLINKITDFSYDKEFWKYVSHKPTIDVLEDLLGPNIVASHAMLINKPPNADPKFSRFPTHQDLHYFPFRPVEKIVGTWTAAEWVDESNGCLYVIPGSHKLPLQKHTYPSEGSSDGKQNLLYHEIEGFHDLKKQVYLEMDKGDTLFFHPQLFHGSGPNLSNGFRKALSAHYVASDIEYVDVKTTGQEEVAKEIQDAMEKFGLKNVSFHDFWMLKARTVRGDRGNFYLRNRL